MRTDQKLLTRPPVKRREIVGCIRSGIVRGRFPPGARLPTRERLERRFGVSSVTVQGAFDVLRREGFVEPRGTLGTFVARHPPNLWRYALVFPSGWPEGVSRFWEAIGKEFQALEDVSPVRAPRYCGVDGHEDSEDYQRLLAEVDACRLAGVIFAFTPFMLLDTPLMETPNVCRVAIMTGSPRIPVPAVYPDLASFWQKALAYLASRGHRRVGGIVLADTPETVLERIIPTAQRLGLRMKPHWVQGVHQNAKHWAARCVRLLMGREQSEPPDALIIADDNLVEHATEGLRATGVRVPEDVEVVAHCNFPWPPPAMTPVTRLGFDVRAVVRRCIEIIDMQRRGEPPPMMTQIPARLENEQDKSWSDGKETSHDQK